MRGTEIEPLLGFGNTSDQRTGEAFAAKQQSKGRSLERLIRRADQGDVTVTAKHVEVGVDVVIGSDGVEDEVEGTGLRQHFFSIGGDDDFMAAYGPQQP